MKIAIVTDAWHPQVNGVVRTLTSVSQHLRDMGHDVLVISPDQFANFPCPTYPEIRLALASSRTVGHMLEDFAPDAIHLSTEGPLCLAARRWCMREGRAFTTAFHTMFPDYVARRTGVSPEWIWPLMRRFHSRSARVMVATDSIAEQLRTHGITHLAHWGRGVDLKAFTPDAPPPDLFADLPRPILLYVGRIAVEKNVEAFLAADVPGSKVVVGDGPAREELEQKFAQVHFLGPKSGEELAGCYAGADCFVFPSRTDTFGLVMIEALACGTPVAAYPVPGPQDVLEPHVGAMAQRLEDAVASALLLDRDACAAYGSRFTWEASAREFLAALEPAAEAPAPERAA